MDERPIIPAVEKVHRCTYCGRELHRNAFARRENPLCEHCLHARLSEGASAHRPSRWVLRDGYLIPIRDR